MRELNKKVFNIITLIFFMVIAGCSDRPSNVLKEKEMVSLLVDMQLTEAYTTTRNNLTGHDREDLGKRVLEAHGVSQETLDTTLAWYGRNMDEYSELFSKVDLELQKRKKKYTEIPGKKEEEIDNLWPYGQHLILSPLSGYDSFSFSLPHPDVKKGEIIKLSFYLPNSTSLKNVIGVEYTDGYGEAIISSSSRNKIEIELQTDTLKEISRLYGTIQAKELKSLPLYIDSIFVKTEPIDSLNYRSKKRQQKTFGPL